MDKDIVAEISLNMVGRDPLEIIHQDLFFDKVDKIEFGEKYLVLRFRSSSTKFRISIKVIKKILNDYISNLKESSYKFRE